MPNIDLAALMWCSQPIDGTDKVWGWFNVRGTDTHVAFWAPRRGTRGSDPIFTFAVHQTGTARLENLKLKKSKLGFVDVLDQHEHVMPNLLAELESQYLHKVLGGL